MGDKRINKEIKDFKKNKDFKMTQPKSTDIKTWYAEFTGPKNSVYEKCKFKVEIVYPSDYPFKPPKTKFLNRVFHPNVKMSTGEICMDILKDKWSPVLDTLSLLISLKSLLTDPNTDSPLNLDAAKLYKSDKKKYMQEVQKNMISKTKKDTNQSDSSEEESPKKSKKKKDKDSSSDDDS